MSNRNEAGEAKAPSNCHRETTATAPVLDSTRVGVEKITPRKCSGKLCAGPEILHGLEKGGRGPIYNPGCKQRLRV